MKTLKRLGCLAAGVMGFMVLCTLAVVVNTSRDAARAPVAVTVAPAPAPDPDKTWRIATRLSAKKEIMQWVKHPLDASLGTMIAEPHDGGWMAKGTIEAKNDFGGTLTHSYAIVYDVIDDKLSLRTVIIDGKTKWVADRLKAQ